jgi:uncharacterized protein
MIFDPMYFLFILPGLGLSLWASARVKSTFNQYSRVRSMRGYTGAEAAQALLRSAGITDVRIVRSRGLLSDHYNPVNKTLGLSDGVYDSPSIAAVGVAAHEAGHAIQHAQHYAPLWVRSMLVPTASIGSSLGYFVMLMGVIVQATNMVLIGALLFSAVLLFQIVTLPVEFNASNRAKIRGHLQRHARGEAVEDASDSRALLALQGPQAISILRAVGADEALLRLEPQRDVISQRFHRSKNSRRTRVDFIRKKHLHVLFVGTPVIRMPVVFEYHRIHLGLHSRLNVMLNSALFLLLHLFPGHGRFSNASRSRATASSTESIS